MASLALEEADVDLQTLIGIVALLHGHIHKGVEGVGVPVQHHVQLLQVAGGVVVVVVLGAAAADAAQQQHAGQQHGYDTFHLYIPLLCFVFRIRPASGRPSSPAAPPAPPPPWPRRTAARWGEDARAVQLGHHAAGEIAQAALCAQPLADGRTDDAHGDGHFDGGEKYGSVQGTLILQKISRFVAP